MGIYQCEKCGCVDNTAKGYYHCVSKPEWFIFEDQTDIGKKLCTVCGPKLHSDGELTEMGVWHNIFPRNFYSLGSLETDGQGNVRNKITKEYPKVEDRIEKPEGVK